MESDFAVALTSALERPGRRDRGHGHELESQLGTGPVTGRMTAYVIEAGLPER